MRKVGRHERGRRATHLGSNRCSAQLAADSIGSPHRPGSPGAARCDRHPSGRPAAGQRHASGRRGGRSECAGVATGSDVAASASGSRRSGSIGGSVLPAGLCEFAGGRGAAGSGPIVGRGSGRRGGGVDRGREVDRVLVPSLRCRRDGGDSRDSASASMPRRRHDVGMRISARADYAVRAVIEVAAADPARAKSDQIASTQAIPVKFLEQIMADLRRVGIVASKRVPTAAMCWSTRHRNHRRRRHPGRRWPVCGCGTSGRVRSSTRAAPSRSATWVAVRAALRGVPRSRHHR